MYIMKLSANVEQVEMHTEFWRFLNFKNPKSWEISIAKNPRKILAQSESSDPSAYKAKNPNDHQD